MDPNQVERGVENATTPTLESRVDTLARLSTIYYGNPATRSGAVLEKMRTEIAELSKALEGNENPQLMKDVRSAEALLNATEQRQAA